MSAKKTAKDSKTKSQRKSPKPDRKAERTPVTTTQTAHPIAGGDARAGDLIVIDSAQVGSPAREGEILSVMTGEIGVRYEVRWSDGRRSVITPGAGAAQIVRR